MEFQDKALRCVTCGAEFVWTSGEQAFFAEKHFTHEPKHCKACKRQRTQRPAPTRERLATPAVCAVCGKDTTVPFRPTQGRPVLCRDCFDLRKHSGAAG
jgi:CxxC-x17-CxxC domain-containing protein